MLFRYLSAGSGITGVRLGTESVLDGADGTATGNKSVEDCRSRRPGLGNTSSPGILLTMETS